MARLNTRATVAVAPRTHEGAPAARINAEHQLRRSVMACLLWERQFYEDGIEIADRIAGLVPEVGLDRVAEMAIEARENMKLRHVPLLLVREMARIGGEHPIVGETIARVIQRPDELTEFLAIYWKDKKQPISAQSKIGLARAFNKFDAYQLAKYDRPAAIRLRDVMFLTHPKPESDEQQKTWEQLIDGTLPPPQTWEVALSAGADKRTAWENLLREGRLGAMAMLRNLRNMQEANVDEGLIRNGLANLNVARVLPFRFIAAAKYAPRFETDLELAMFRATDSLERLPGKTALLIDHSGSMEVPLSTRSDLTRFDAACGLAILIREVCEQAEIIAFSDWQKSIPARRGFALAEAIKHAGRFWGTMTEDAKRYADGLGYDRIIIVTDEQSHQMISDPQGLGYVVNVASYKNGIGYGHWVHVDGFSENVVEYIRLYEAEFSGRM